MIWILFNLFILRVEGCPLQVKYKYVDILQWKFTGEDRNTEDNNCQKRSNYNTDITMEIGDNKRLKWQTIRCDGQALQRTVSLQQAVIDSIRVRKLHDWSIKIDI